MSLDRKTVADATSLFDTLTPSVEVYTAATTKDVAREASSFHTPQERSGKGKSPANLNIPQGESVSRTDSRTSFDARCCQKRLR